VEGGAMSPSRRVRGHRRHRYQQGQVAQPSELVQLARHVNQCRRETFGGVIWPHPTWRETRVKIADLIDRVVSEAGLDKSAAKRAVFAGIVGAATKGEEINLPGFGKFKER